MNEERDQQFFTELEEVLDQYFPKVEEEGEEKRLMKRGDALMLFTEANLIHSRRMKEAQEKAKEEGYREGLEKEQIAHEERVNEVADDRNKFWERELKNAEAEKDKEFVESLGQIELLEVHHEKWCDFPGGDRCNCGQSDLFSLQKEIKELKEKYSQDKRDI